LNGTDSTATVTFSAPNPALTTGTTGAHSGVVTVTNAAGGPLILTANPTVVKVSGPGGPGTFSVITGGTCTSGLVVAAGGSCTINVQYAPPGNSTTTATAHVVITGNASPTTSANFSAN
jgi:hypothetical protein